MNEYVGSRVDRSFLYLMAIYVIHGILLHEFLRPINADNINSDKELIRTSSDDWRQFLDNKNISSVSVKIDENYRVIGNLDNENRSINQQLSEGNPRDAFINILVKSKSSGSSSLSAAISAFLISVTEKISPAAWGIISGCIVFSLTFTENDNVR